MERGMPMGLYPKVPFRANSLNPSLINQEGSNTPLCAHLVCHLLAKGLNSDQSEYLECIYLELTSLHLHSDLIFLTFDVHLLQLNLPTMYGAGGVGRASDVASSSGTGSFSIRQRQIGTLM
jgi:hypothetical protein